MNYEWQTDFKYRVRRGMLYITLVIAYIWAENATF
jgi:hypothetical protein